MILVKEIDYTYNDRMLEIVKNSPIETKFLKLEFDKSPDFFLCNSLWSKKYKYYGVVAVKIHRINDCWLKNLYWNTDVSTPSKQK